MTYIHSWRLQMFKSDNLKEAAQIAYSLGKRGYVRVGLNDDLVGEQYKTYARIEVVKGAEATKFYFVEYMAPVERWGA